jgi:hypothetical protein
MCRQCRARMRVSPVTLFTQLATSTAMVLLTTLVHLAGLAGLLMVIRRRDETLSPRRRWRDVVGIVSAAIALFVLHGIEIWAYAALYLVTGALADLGSALYFSTTTYTTIGYGDVLLGVDWRIVGAIEGANGIILLGWSTAFFVAIVRRMRFVEREFEG